LLNLDIRDLIYWTREAKKKRIINQIDQLNSVRISTNASNEDYMRLINNLESRLYQAEGVLNKLVQQNWENLKIKKRG